MAEANVGGLGVSKNFKPTYTGAGGGVTKTEGNRNEVTFQLGSPKDSPVGTVYEVPLAQRAIFVETEAFVDRSASQVSGVTGTIAVYDTTTGLDILSEVVDLSGTNPNKISLTTINVGSAGSNDIGLRFTVDTNPLTDDADYVKFTVEFLNSTGDYNA